jgi:AraC-like DNA-binding protein
MVDISTENAIIQLNIMEPNLNQTEVARRLGVSRQRVSQLCKKTSLRFTGKYRHRYRLSHNAQLNRYGFHGKRRNPAFAGATGEMIVAAHLMQRGIPVYRSIAAEAAFDLVADCFGELLRVEVRSAKRTAKGFNFPRPDKSRYDLLALVTPDTAVTFRAKKGFKIPDSFI